MSMDEQLTDMLSREEVVVLTDRNMIQGTMCRHTAIRFSDSINAAVNRDSPYLPLVSAKVTDIKSGKPICTARFLMVARARIEVILPMSDLTANYILEPPTSSEPRGESPNAERLLDEVTSYFTHITE